MIRLVTRDSMMLDYVWNFGCFECDCQNENGTGTVPELERYDII